MPLGVRTLIAGVLNVTPDSFSDGGLYLDVQKAIQHAHEMVEQGVDWIDVGGESTRPGVEPVSAAEELRRVLPVIREVHRDLPRVPISVDTTKSVVAEEALKAGASILNDVSGLRFDSRIAELARAHHAALILMHIRGNPATMQQRPFARSIRQSLGRGLAWSVRRALKAGVRRSQLIVDPGLGFGKSRRQNFEILSNLNVLRDLRLPILVAASRKSFLQAVIAGEGLRPTRSPRLSYWKLTGERKKIQAVGKLAGDRAAQPEPATLRNPAISREAMSALDLGDAAAAVAAVLAGAHIIRAHSISAVLPAVRVADAILACERD